jgi:murein DD-endopeptidase MepM/ murein hydrolase activator NlpD
LKYDGAPQNPKAYVPLNFNGLSLGSHAKQNGLGDRLLRGFEALTQPKAPEAPPEAPSGNMGVIRYNVASPIETYRMQRRRRHARFQAYGRPLLIAACLALAIPVGVTVVGKLGSPGPVAQASVAETEKTDAAPTTDLLVSPPAELPTETAATLADAAPAAPQAMPEAPVVTEQIVKVRSGDTLERIARRNGLTTRELADFNDMKNLHALRVGQEIRIPVAQEAAKPEPAKPAATAFKAPAVPLVLAPKPEQPAASDAAKLAAAPSAEEVSPEAKPKSTEPVSYTIRSGDSLSKIASRHGIKASTLASANDLSANDTLSVGKVLKVPPADGVYVKVRAGESLSHLATRYGLKASAIQEANGIANPRSLREGQTLFLPGAEPQAVSREARRERGDFKQASRGLIGDLGRAVGKKFIWPTAGKVSSYFGERDGRQHHGVDIPRPKGSPIHAAKAGTVIAAGWNGDYGKCVDISHGNGVVTRYAHCSKITVKTGDTVSKGELIGLVGETGRASGPHLHYEVRIGGRPVNPTKFHN